jgi:chaperonin GroES
MTVKIKPLHDRILVERIEQESKTSGGIIIPDTVKEKPMEGKVISVGNGLRDDKGNVKPLDVKAGDIVLFAKWGGTEVKIDGKEYIIMKETDVLATIEK